MTVLRAERSAVHTAGFEGGGEHPGPETGVGLEPGKGKKTDSL